MGQSNEIEYLQKAKTFYAHVQEGKWDEAGTFVSDDFVILEAPDLPFGGAVHGKPAIRKSFETLKEALEITGIEFHQMTQGGEYIVSVLDIVAKGNEGRELRLGIAEVMRFRDGLISEVKPHYFDHALVREAVEYKSSLRS